MKVLIAAVMLLTAMPANANSFVSISFDLNKGTLVAIDLDTIREVGIYKRAWVLTVVAQSATKAPLYAQSLTEFDCKAERSQILSRKLYTEADSPMGDLDPQPWTYVVPATAEYDVLKYGCGKQASEDEVIRLSPPLMAKSFLYAYRHKGAAK